MHIMDKMYYTLLQTEMIQYLLDFYNLQNIKI